MCSQAGGTRVHAVTCLMSQWWSGPSVDPAQGTEASPTPYSLQTHTHTHTKLNHMLEVDMHLTPLCQSASVLSYFSFHFPLFLCWPSVFSEAFYYVTQTDGTWQPTTPFVPHLLKKARCLCLAICNLTPLHKMFTIPSHSLSVVYLS